jgi:D-alanyl-D-alanine carboxypeptidase (penicillin-binding protein 5/6)
MTMKKGFSALAVAGAFLSLAAPVCAGAPHAIGPSRGDPAASARLPPAVVPPPAAAEQPIGTETQAIEAYIVEVETGTVLLAKNADVRFPPASMSKMMTAYVVFSMLKDGRIKLTDTLPVSERAWRLGGSKMFVPLGARISIDDLLQGMLVDSGNDACLVLAEGLAGSEAGFVARMNAMAQKIGLKDSHFDNVTGLPDPNEWVTARDLATLALRTIRDFPQFYHYYGQLNFTFSNIKQGNRNPLLYANVGADGLKTGYTKASGYGLTGALVQGRRRIVLVLGGLPSMKARTEESERLANWALRSFADYTLFRPGEAVDEVPVWLGAAPRVTLTVGKDLVVTLRRGAVKQAQVVAQYDSPIPAPVGKGSVVGTLLVSAPDAPTRQMPLVAAAHVGRMDAFARIATLAGYLIWGRH